MEIKKLKSSIILSLILSIFAFIFDIITSYLFLFISALSSIGGENLQYFLSKTTFFLNIALASLMLFIFVLSIVLLKKLKQYEKNEKGFPKKLSITFIIVTSLAFLFNLLIGVFNIISYIGWLFIVVAVIFLILVLVYIFALKSLQKKPIEIDNNN